MAMVGKSREITTIDKINKIMYNGENTTPAIAGEINRKEVNNDRIYYFLLSQRQG